MLKPLENHGKPLVMLTWTCILAIQSQAAYSKATISENAFQTSLNSNEPKALTDLVLRFHRKRLNGWNVQRWLVVEPTHFEGSACEIGSFPQKKRMNIKFGWNHPPSLRLKTLKPSDVWFFAGFPSQAPYSVCQETPVLQNLRVSKAANDEGRNAVLLAQTTAKDRKWMLVGMLWLGEGM